MDIKWRQIFSWLIKFLKHYFGGLYHRVGDNHIFLFGAGLSFSIITCIVPFVLIMIYLLGQVLQSGSVNHQIDTFIDTVIPYVSYAAKAKNILHSRIDEVIEYKNIAGYIGAIGLLFAASGLFSSMRTSLNLIFKASGNRVYIGKLRDLGMVLLIIVFVMLSTAALPLFEVIRDSAEKVEILKMFHLTGFQGNLYFIISFSTIFLMFFAMYNLIPNRRLGFRVPALGALWATLLWIVAKEVFGYYITNMVSLKRIYGTYMFFAVLTFWIYYSSVIFLVGAQIAQLFNERREMKKENEQLEIADL